MSNMTDADNIEIKKCWNELDVHGVGREWR